MKQETNTNLIPSKEEIFSWIEHFCSFGHRRSGTENNWKSAQFIAEKFKEFGMEDVRFDHPDAKFFFPEEWSLTVEGERIPCYFINYTNYDGKVGNFDTGEITAELVYVGDGRPEDFEGVDVEGKIVIANNRWFDYDLDFFEKNHASDKCWWYDPRNTVTSYKQYLHKNTYDPNTFPQNYCDAINKGAVGFIGVLIDNCNHYEHYNENYSQAYAKFLDQEKYHFNTMYKPGLWISRDMGEYLRDKIAAAGGNLRATMRIKDRVEASHANVVSGILPGMSDEIILVHSHHDSSFEGAIQDASGMSVVMAIAKYFSQIPKEKRKKTLMFGAMDSHFSGYAGHEGFIKRVQDEKKNIIMDFVVEHVAMEAIDDISLKGKADEMRFTDEINFRLVYVTENEKMLTMLKDAMEENNLERTLVVPCIKGKADVCSDGDRFFKAGIPVVSIIAPPIYLMDPVDKPDKVAVEQLPVIAKTWIDMINNVFDHDGTEFKEQENLHFFGKREE
ncbi:MAG: M28 family peptidase [Firmicutes bacterium]|nr:M28 family peptidase [Bacillota bacterium]